MAGATAVVALLTLFGLAHERDNAFAATLSGLLGGLVLSLPLWAILISLGRRDFTAASGWKRRSPPRSPN